MAISFVSVDTEIEPLWIAKNGHGICLTRLGGTEAEFADHCEARLGERPTETSDPVLIKAVKARLGTDGPLEFDLSGCSPFQRQVLEALNQIPRGEVRTYRQVAEQLGQPQAARVVGHALATNPIPVLIPCHRVIRTDGGLGGYTPRLEMKSALLKSEGALN